MSETNKTAASTTSGGRKAYAPPRLVSYGHVKDIVQGNTGNMADAGTTRANCWVAEALYGVEDPRTLVLRAWLTEIHVQKRRGWWLVELYGALGPTIARLLRGRRLPRRAFLPLFDALSAKAFTARARMIRHERNRRPV